VGRPSLTTRTRAVLERLAGHLDTPGKQVGALGGGVVLSVGLHALLDAPSTAWLAAPVVLAAGVAGGTTVGLWTAVVAVVGHGAVDLTDGIDASGAVGVAIRSAVLPFLGIAGAAGAQLERQRDRALHQAVSEDPVTGLLNVRVFYDEVARLRTEGRPFAILLADIRGMRLLNDTYGHPTGTEAMRALAHVLRRSAGADVLASRLGSDEIAVLLVGDDRERCPTIVSEAIARLRHETVRLPDGEAFEIHAAYGVARWPEDGDDAVMLLRAADRAKERAKAHGLDEIGHARGRDGTVLVTAPGEDGPVDASPAGPYDDVTP
jgi:diguanylate cyclase (GGDEF)-like protein